MCCWPLFLNNLPISKVFCRLHIFFLQKLRLGSYVLRGMKMRNAIFLIYIFVPCILPCHFICVQRSLSLFRMHVTSSEWLLQCDERSVSGGDGGGGSYWCCQIKINLIWKCNAPTPLITSIHLFQYIILSASSERLQNDHWVCLIVVRPEKENLTIVRHEMCVPKSGQI